MWFQASSGGLGMYTLWIRGNNSIMCYIPVRIEGYEVREGDVCIGGNRWWQFSGGDKMGPGARGQQDIEKGRGERLSQPARKGIYLEVCS